MSDTSKEDNYRERLSPAIQELWVLLGKPTVLDDQIIEHGISAIRVLRLMLINGAKMHPQIVDDIIREATGNDFQD